MLKTLIIIPARFASSRFPGKPLALIKGAHGTEKSLLRRSWETAKTVKNIEEIIIATDDNRIADHAKTFGAQVMMTPSSARNGTERCSIALQNLAQNFDVIINFQGDAPLTPSWFIEALIAYLEQDSKASAATPVLRCSGAMRARLREDRLAGRVGATTAIFDKKGYALYFSKEVIPFSNDDFANNTPTPVFHHVGVYAYRPDVLQNYNALGVSRYEEHEGLEQLRFVENGFALACVEVDAQGHDFWELNNPEDIPKIETILRARNKD